MCLTIAEKPQDRGLGTNQRALLICGIFTGNVTKYYHALDLTINKYAKAFTRKKFHKWNIKHEVTTVFNKASAHALNGGVIQTHGRKDRKNMNRWRATGIREVRIVKTYEKLFLL